MNHATPQGLYPNGIDESSESVNPSNIDWDPTNDLTKYVAIELLDTPFFFSGVVQWVSGILELHPRKLTCPLKNNGWFRCISY